MDLTGRIPCTCIIKIGVFQFNFKYIIHNKQLSEDYLLEIMLLRYIVSNENDFIQVTFILLLYFISQ